MFLSIILLPLLGSIVSGFFGRKVGVNGAQWMTCISIIITAVLVVLAFFEVGFNNSSTFIYLFRWIESEWFNIIWSFQFDSLTVSMLIPVLIISSLVHIYSLSYMSNDPHNQRFFSYLSLFTFMMIILVTANNYLLMFVGWEGVGVCSFLLVSFWFTRIAANQSSMSAFLTNRVGDCFLTIGMFVLIWSLGNLDYATIFSLAPYLNENIITVIGICLLIGAMAKSSQIGLHIWLPMAMEGPTPVSALIHAATMVTAGVYLLMRSSPLIEYSSNLLLLCLWLGAITTVFSSLIGLFQQDIKKVIAYSTMSQLGMMVIAIGLSSYNIALFHLINHAFYKGLLFLGAGSVIHAVVDNQDFRRYGGLVGHLPLTYSVMFIASLSLVAFPYMTGFFSKDLILESAFGNHSFGSIAIYVIATIGAIFTTLYSVKVLYLTFIAKPNGSLQSYKYAHEGNVFLSLPLVLLAIFSIFFGFITKEIFIGLGSDFFVDNSLFIHPLHEIFINTEFAVPVLFKLLPFVFTLVFGWLTYAVLEYGSEILINFKFSRFGYNLFGFFNQRFLIEMFYNKYIVNSVLNLGGQTTKSLDKGSLELIGPFGLEKHLVYLSASINSLSKSNPVDYALFFVIGSILLLFTLFLDIHVILLIILLLGFITLFTNFSEKLKTLESTFIVKLFSTKRLFSTTNVCYVSDSSDDDDYNSDRHYVGNLENQNNYNDSSSNSESPRSNDSLDAIETADRFRGNPQGYREHYDRIEERTRTDYQERITTVLNSRLPEEERNARIGALRSNLEDELGYFEEDFNAGLERVNATQEELNAIDENRTRPEIQDALSTIRMRDEMHTQNLLNRDLDSQSPPSLSEDDSVQNIVISSRNSVNPEENQLLNENNNDNQEIKSDNNQEAKSDNSQEAISDNSQEVKSDNNQEIKSDNSQEIKSDDGNSNNPESESDNINENKGDPANSSEIENSDLNPVNQPNLMPEDNIISTEEENKITETDVKDKLDDTINQEGESSKSENQNKRSHSEVESSSDSEERPTKKTKESLIDYVLEKQACEMPDIPESDGGGD